MLYDNNIIITFSDYFFLFSMPDVSNDLFNVAFQLLLAVINLIAVLSDKEMKCAYLT
jgi:hypothetical protein